MDEDEFINCINSDFPHLQISKKDINTPSPEMLRKYYMTMLENVTRFSITQLCGYNRVQREFLQNGNIDTAMETNISSYNLYLAVKYIFNTTDSFKREFHYSDILFPYLTPKRSYVFMVNMYMFYVTCADFDACFEEMDTADNKHQQMLNLQQEIEALKEKIQLCKDTKIQYAERARDIKNELASYHDTSEQHENYLKELQHKMNVENGILRQLEEQEANLQTEFAKIDNEKKYYESLVVSDEGSILNQHSKLLNKKEECMVDLQRMETKRREGLFKDSQFDTVLELQGKLINNLKDEVLVENEKMDLKGLNTLSVKLKGDKQLFENEEKSLKDSIKEKQGTLPCRQKEIQSVETENDSIKCTWQEKSSRYKDIIETHKRLLSESTQKLQIEEKGLQVTREKISSLEQSVGEKEKQIVLDVQKQLELAADFKNKIREKILITKLKAEEFKGSS